MSARNRLRTLTFLICLAPPMFQPGLHGDEARTPEGWPELVAFRLSTHVGDKTLSLARAIPAESYAWRPADGVRSVAEAFTHVASSYYWFGAQLGAEPATDPPAWDEVRHKEEVLSALEKSLEFVRLAVLSLSEEDLAQPVEFFGRETTRRELLLNLTTHGSEHLGQAIAYARVLGVTPPWSLDTD